METIQFIKALYYLYKKGEVRFHSYFTEAKFQILFGISGLEIMTEDGWNNLIDWNPPGFGGNSGGLEKESNVSPKPTWQEMVDAYYSSLLGTDNYTEDDHQIGERSRVNQRTKDALADKPIDNVHVGAGLMHMSGLAHMVESANIAGNSINHMVMRTEDGKLTHIYTQKEMREILGKLAERENIIESAHNAIMQKHQVLLAKSMNTSLAPKERFEARKDAFIMISRYDEYLGEDITDKNYEANLLKEIKAYDPTTMPDDLETLRKVFIEKLEAVATKKIADIKNAVTQHGVDLPPSCLDQENAIGKVGNKKQKGQIELMRATTKQNLKDLFDVWSARINNVKVQNVPRWTDGSNTYDENDATNAIAITGREFSYTAKSPVTTPPITGQVVVENFEAWGNDGLTFEKISASLQGNKVRFIVDNDVAAGVEILIRITARNLCGPSYLHLQMTTGALPT